MMYDRKYSLPVQTMRGSRPYCGTFRGELTRPSSVIVAKRPPSFAVQTIPKRGYKFVAPVEAVGSQVVQAAPQARTDGTLSKLLWSHIADLRIAEDRRKKRRRAVLIGVSVAIGVALIATIVVWMMRLI